MFYTQFYVYLTEGSDYSRVIVYHRSATIIPVQKNSLTDNISNKDSSAYKEEKMK